MEKKYEESLPSPTQDGLWGQNQCLRESTNIWKSAYFELVHTLLGSYFNRSMLLGSHAALRNAA